ncbi:MAG: hypothetical protein GQ574_26655 [Crocinitomix sp.]|nr:hypothetical protein [Crocinitomix sp.]
MKEENIDYKKTLFKTFDTKRKEFSQKQEKIENHVQEFLSVKLWTFFKYLDNGIIKNEARSSVESFFPSSPVLRALKLIISTKDKKVMLAELDKVSLTNSRISHMKKGTVQGTPAQLDFLSIYLGYMGFSGFKNDLSLKDGFKIVDQTTFISSEIEAYPKQIVDTRSQVTPHSGDPIPEKILGDYLAVGFDEPIKDSTEDYKPIYFISVFTIFNEGGMLYHGMPSVEREHIPTPSETHYEDSTDTLSFNMVRDRKTQFNMHGKIRGLREVGHILDFPYITDPDSNFTRKLFMGSAFLIKLNKRFSNDVELLNELVGRGLSEEKFIERHNLEELKDINLPEKLKTIHSKPFPVFFPSANDPIISTQKRKLNLMINSIDCLKILDSLKNTQIEKLNEVQELIREVLSQISTDNEQNSSFNS